jgi:hypothetical protein
MLDAPCWVAASFATIPPGQIAIGPSDIDGDQDQDNDFTNKASIPPQWSERPTALRGE